MPVGCVRYANAGRIAWSRVTPEGCSDRTKLFQLLSFRYILDIHLINTLIIRAFISISNITAENHFASIDRYQCSEFSCQLFSTFLNTLRGEKLKWLTAKELPERVKPPGVDGWHILWPSRTVPYRHCVLPDLGLEKSENEKKHNNTNSESIQTTRQRCNDACVQV